MAFSARSLLAHVRRLDPAQIDRLAALALLAAFELQIWLDPAFHHPVPPALAGIVASAAVSVRRRWPLAAVIAGVSATIAQDAAVRPAVGPLAGIVAGVLLSYGAGAFLAERRARVALALGVAGLAFDVLITTQSGADLFFDAIIVGLLPWSAGQMVRARGARERAHRESAERLDAERDLRARSAADAERARIARELHDVIAHSVSVMVIQAGGARIVMGSDPSRAEDSLRSVEQAGREALAEMRRLLGLLDAGTDPRALAPQPRLADIGDLVARARVAGLATELQVEGDAAPAVSPALDLCAYRIVQEALTNAIKHAGPAPSMCACAGSRTRSSSRSPTTVAERPAAAATSGGHGIAGMRERAALHGGQRRRRSARGRRVRRARPSCR